MVRLRRGRRHAQARLRAIAHSLPGTVYVLRITPDGRKYFDFLSTNTPQTLGIERDRVLRDATTTDEVVLEEDRAHLDAAVARSAADLSLLEVDFRIRRPDGGIRWLRSSGIPARQSNGDMVWNGYWFDITASKATEDALREATRRLEDAQDVAHIGDWTCDLATGEVTWSPQVHKMLRHDPSSGTPDLEQGVALFRGGAEATAEAFFRAQESGEPQAYEMTVEFADGQASTFQVIAVPSKDAAGTVTGMHGTIQDISSRKALEARLEQARTAADNASRAKSVFLATMSHEIRTHLNGMLGLLEVVFMTRLDPQLRNALEGVRESGKSLQQIIDDILDFSKVEAGKLDVRPEPTSIAELVAGVQRIHAGSASSLGLEMRHWVDPAIAPAVMIDGLRLRQILGNFVSNAIKFTPSGRVEIRARLLAQEGDRQRLRLQVEDTGIGISPERQQRLFQPFEQAEAHTASRFGGTGLGLSISRRLAELMGGEIAMHSELGKGTTMSLDIDVGVVPPDHPPAPARASPGPGLQRAAHADPPSATEAASNGTLVLVVDDHPVNRIVMRSQLNILGYAVEEADCGADALELWRSGRFGLVLTDCNMPFMSGYDLSQRIRGVEADEGRRRTPIVACSANVIGSVQQDCRDAGMDDYSAKPTELVPLAEIMDRWLPLPGRRAEAAAGAAEPAAAATPADAGAWPVDTEVLRRMSGGDPAAARRVIGNFRRSNEADAALLLHAAECADLPALAHVAHRIKGACGFIGAGGLAAACAGLERAARSADAAAVDGLMPVFRSELERLNAYLEAESRA